MKSTRALASDRRAVTLIEMIVFIFGIGCAVYGSKLGIDFTRGMGAWWQLTGLALGALAGAISAIAFIFLLLTPFEIYAAARRALEPAALECQCNKPGHSVPDFLSPATPLDQAAIVESRRWHDSPLIHRLHLDRPPASDKLRSQVTSGALTDEQLSLAACLGEPAAMSLTTPSTQSLLKYDHSARIPHDLRLVLRSGLPPRLCMVWATTCAARALEEFEREFHQDTRPRQKFGLALMVLQENCAGEAFLALDAWRQRGWYSGGPTERGCRVLHRTLWQRVRGDSSPGQLASDAVFRFASAVANYIEPRGLWEAYSDNDRRYYYETPRNRIAWNLPCYAAEEAAYEASRIAESRDEEFARQRTDLARMILAWDQWEQDRNAWQARVEGEWIPRIEANAARLPFDVPEYIEKLRQAYAPWSNRVSA